MKRWLRFSVPVALSIVWAWVSVPVHAQELFIGDWAAKLHQDWQERGTGPEVGDYTGLPINDAARTWADSWDAARMSLQEHQCASHLIAYDSQAPFGLRIQVVRDPESMDIVAIQFYFHYQENLQTVWLDGRPHPSKYARHSINGFSTGSWDGNVLTVYTTHMKQGWLRRNGLPYSPEVTMTEFWTRRGPYLSHFKIVTDPVYLTEPETRTDNFVYEPNQTGSWKYPCEETKDEVSGHPQGWVPSFLFGQNPSLKEFSDAHEVPYEAARGGAETMYPDYQKKLKDMPRPTKKEAK